MCRTFGADLRRIYGYARNHMPKIIVQARSPDDDLTVISLGIVDEKCEEYFIRANVGLLLFIIPDPAMLISPLNKLYYAEYMLTSQRVILRLVSPVPRGAYFDVNVSQCKPRSHEQLIY